MKAIARMGVVLGSLAAVAPAQVSDRRDAPVPTPEPNLSI